MSCLIHKWNGCKCEKCGKIRDKQHDWDGCKCKRCGIDGNHDWDGCKCKKCGEIRDALHDYDGCICKCCGAEKHDWKTVGTIVTGGYSNPFAEEGYRTIKCERCGKWEEEYYSI